MKSLRLDMRETFRVQRFGELCHRLLPAAWKPSQVGPGEANNSMNSPNSVEELQKVLKVANQYRIPVWTISRGKNLG